jgi:flagellar motility protein MotE (MotC chaperone)
MLFMGRMVVLLSIVMILFGVAAGASWYLQSQQTKDHEPTPVADDKKSKKTGGDLLPKQSVGEGALPKPLIRATPSPDTERLSQFAASLQNQQEALKLREQQVGVREKQMDIIHDEIKKEQKRLDGVKKKIDEEMAALVQMLEKVEKSAADGRDVTKSLAAEKTYLQQTTIGIEDLEWQNLKNQSKTFEKMDPEAAASFVTNLVDKGNMDTAAKILSMISNRKAAEIFKEINTQDPKLPPILIERILLIKSPTVQAPK